MLTYVAREFVV